MGYKGWNIVPNLGVLRTSSETGNIYKVFGSSRDSKMLYEFWKEENGNFVLDSYSENANIVSKDFEDIVMELSKYDRVTVKTIK